MPRGDRTGPAGTGAMTGRGAGYCAGFEAPGYSRLGPGRGFWGMSGRGRGVPGRRFAGGGYGWRRMFYATGLPGFMRFGEYLPFFGDQVPPADFEKQALKRRAAALESELNFINQHLAGLEKEASDA